MVYFNDLGNVYKLIRFTKQNELYSILVLNEKYEQIFKSDYIYDELQYFGKNVRCYQRQPYVLARQGENWGVFNPVNLKFVVPIEYSKVELKEYHKNLIFICQRRIVIIFEEIEYIFYDYRILDIYGNDLFPGQTFDNLDYMGEFSDSENYLFLATQIDKTNPLELIYSKGIINLRGQIIFPFSIENNIFKFSRINDFLIVLFYGEIVEETNAIGKIIKRELVSKVDLINSNGMIIENNISYQSIFDYYSV